MAARASRGRPRHEATASFMADKETFYILGKNENEFVALLKTDKDLIAINLKGMIRINKIPDLINSLNADNFLNVFEVGKGERREHKEESRQN